MQAVGAAALAGEMPALKSHLTRWLFLFVPCTLRRTYDCSISLVAVHPCHSIYIPQKHLG